MAIVVCWAHSTCDGAMTARKPDRRWTPRARVEGTDFDARVIQLARFCSPADIGTTDAPDRPADADRRHPRLRRPRCHRAASGRGFVPGWRRGGHGLRDIYGSDP